MSASKMSKVPFVDLSAQYQRYKSELDDAIRGVIEATSFIGGAPVRDFERAFASMYGVRHCISCGNGTDAIYIVLKMLGIGPGDEVITTASSWISTSETISQAGATPVFVDVDEYFCIDVEKVAEKIGPRTRAIIPVHLYGQAAQVDRLAALASERGLHLIEDCAQAHFAERNGKRVGLFGVASTFSFYPGKNLGAYGDAGAIITNDDLLAEKMRMYANHGALIKHEHRMEGLNSRMDGLQAAILLAKLPHIGEWTEARQRIARAYDDGLCAVPQVTRPKVREASTHVFHLYVIKVADREALKAWLGERGIETAVHYPTALPLLEAYRYLGVNPATVHAAVGNAKSILSLPLFPEMTDEQVTRVVEVIKDFYRR